MYEEGLKGCLHVTSALKGSLPQQGHVMLSMPREMHFGRHDSRIITVIRLKNQKSVMAAVRTRLSGPHVAR